MPIAVQISSYLYVADAKILRDSVLCSVKSIREQLTLSDQSEQQNVQTWFNALCARNSASDRSAFHSAGLGIQRNCNYSLRADSAICRDCVFNQSSKESDH